MVCLVPPEPFLFPRPRYLFILDRFSSKTRPFVPSRPSHSGSPRRWSSPHRLSRLIRRSVEFTISRVHDQSSSRSVEFTVSRGHRQSISRPIDSNTNRFQDQSLSRSVEAGWDRRRLVGQALVAGSNAGVIGKRKEKRLALHLDSNFVAMGKQLHVRFDIVVPTAGYLA